MRRLTLLLPLLTLLTACEGIDCTLNNVVALRVGLYKSGTDSLLTLPDTLTITAAGTDSVLLNRLTAARTFALPLSYTQPADTFCLNLYGDGYEADDYLIIEKTNTLHYESPDCPTTMFHLITAATHSSPYATVDSVVAVRPTVDYSTDENLRIYYHTDRLPQ